MGFVLKVCVSLLARGRESGLAALILVVTLLFSAPSMFVWP